MGKHRPPFIKKETEKQNKNNTAWWPTLRTILRYPLDHPIKFFVGIVCFATIVDLGRQNATKIVETQHTAPFNPCTTYFNLIGERTSDVDAAKFLVVLEDHKYRSETIQCINYFDPKKIYAESVPRGEALDCSTYGFVGKNDLRCEGADKVTEAMLDLIKAQGYENSERAVTALYNKYHHDKPTVEEFKKWLETLINKIGKDVNKIAKEHNCSEKNFTLPLNHNKTAVLDFYSVATQTISHIEFIKNEVEKTNNVAQAFKTHAEKFPREAKDAAFHNIMSASVTLERNKEFKETMLLASSCTEKRSMILGYFHAYPYPSNSELNEARSYIWSGVNSLIDNGCKVAVLVTKKLMSPMS